MMNISAVGTCPILSTVSVDLSATFEKDGRKFACPGDQVTFTCRTFLSTSVRIVAENFICRSTPVIYIATDPVGSSGPTSATDVFQANLTEVQRDSNQPLVANFTATLEANVTNETADTVVECFGQQTFSCDVLRKNLSQSGTYISQIKSTFLIDAWVCLNEYLLLYRDGTNYKVESRFGTCLYIMIMQYVNNTVPNLYLCCYKAALDNKGKKGLTLAEY